MARIILVTGGCRSGKSRYAQERAEAIGATRLFVATCPLLDAEMERRIAHHRQARVSRGWQTQEEPLKLAAALRTQAAFDVVLVDCLTLWVNNLLFAVPPENRFGEEEMTEAAAELLAACRQRPGTVILVTNEVGLGIVPENGLARRYRDLVGRCNQVAAAAAEEVFFTVCGIPTKIK